MIIKRCSKCNKNLPATSEYFYKQYKGKFGLRSDCKECNIKKVRNYYKENKNDIIEKQKVYINNHKDKYIIYQRKYRNDNRIEIQKCCKEYYLLHRDDIREKNRIYNKTEKGREIQRRKKAKRRYMNYNKLFNNPFDESEEIEWHHINNNDVVAIPKDIHKLYCIPNREIHRDLCNNVIRQIYSL